MKLTLRLQLTKPLPLVSKTMQQVTHLKQMLCCYTLVFVHKVSAILFSNYRLIMSLYKCNLARMM